MKRKLFYLAVFVAVNAFGQDLKKITVNNLLGTGNGDVAWADIDQDGFKDILVCGEAAVGKISKLFLNKKDGTFYDLGIDLVPVSGGGVCFADFNNDNYPDIVITGTDASGKDVSEVYLNNRDRTFTKIPTTLPGTGYSSVACGDLNNDGWTDIVIVGESQGSQIAKIYINNRSGGFEYQDASMEGVYDGDVELVDLNNDSFLDIVISGGTDSKSITNIYYNIKGVFEKKEFSLPGVREGDIAVGDITANGYNDLVLSGRLDRGDYICRIYKNSGGNSFTVYHDFTGIINSSIKLADFNQDGKLDILSSGIKKGGNYETVLYYNDGTGFSNSGKVFANAGRPSNSFVDYNNDKKIDLYINGYALSTAVSELYENISMNENSVPATPEGLEVKKRGGEVVLVWKSATDKETPSKLLNYNVYLGTTSKKGNIISPLADINTGTVYFNNLGAIKDTFLVVKDLPLGNYFWAVQSIDQAGLASTFSAEAKFPVCQGFDLGLDTVICKGSEISWEVGNEGDKVEWFIGGLTTLPIVTGKAFKHVGVKKDTIICRLTRQLGCVLLDSLVVGIHDLPATASVSDTSVCHGESIEFKLNRPNCQVTWWRKVFTDKFKGETYTFDVQAKDSVYVELVDTNGCRNLDTIVVSPKPLPNANLADRKKYCKGDKVEEKVDGDFKQIRWKSTLVSLPDNVKEVSYELMKVDTLSVYLRGANGCENRHSMILEPYDLPNALPGSKKLVCRGGSTLLGDVSSPDAYSYSWSPLTGLNSAVVKMPYAKPIKSMWYKLTVKDKYGCENTDSVFVELDKESVVFAGKDTIICPGDPIVLGGTPTANGSLLPYEYEWFPATGLDRHTAANPIVTLMKDTRFGVVVKTGDCIVDTSYVNIKVGITPNISVTKDMKVGYDELFQVEASGGEFYEWFPAHLFIDSKLPNPSLRLKESAVLAVEVSNAMGCKAKGEVKITIDNHLFVPNLFTPNNDGENDFFKVYGFGLDKLNIKIFNKNGRMIYQSDDINQITEIGWDGRAYGKDQPMGDYVWVLSGLYKDGSEVRINGGNSGVVTLIR